MELHNVERTLRARSIKSARQAIFTLRKMCRKSGWGDEEAIDALEQAKKFLRIVRFGK